MCLNRPSKLISDQENVRKWAHTPIHSRSEVTIKSKRQLCNTIRIKFVKSKVVFAELCRSSAMGGTEYRAVLNTQNGERMSRIRWRDQVAEDLATLEKRNRICLLYTSRCV